MGKGSLRKKYTVKLGEKSKPLLVPPSPFNLGTLNSFTAKYGTFRSRLFKQLILELTF